MILFNALSKSISAGIGRYSFELSRELYFLFKEDIKILVREEDLKDYKFVNSKSLLIFKNIKNSIHRNFCEQVYIPKIVDEQFKDYIVHYPDSMAPIFMKNKKIIITVHDLAFKTFPQGFTKKMVLWKNFMTNISVKKSNKIIAITNFSKSELCKYYKNIDYQKINVIYNGFNKLSDCGIYNNNISHEIDKMCLSDYILTVSTISPRKNIDTLIKAFNLIADRHNNIKLIIVGNNGWLYENIYNLVNESKFKDRILFTGKVNDDELKLLYKNAKVFVYPSLYEGFGLPPLESMSYGVNVIVSDVACFREVLGDSCYYFNPTDYTELSNLLDKFLKKNLDGKNFENVLSKYSWKKCAEETKCIYDEVLKGV